VFDIAALNDTAAMFALSAATFALSRKRSDQRAALSDSVIISFVVSFVRRQAG